MNPLCTFMASSTGRVTRVIAGILIIAFGFGFGGPLGIGVAAVGLVPILAGLFDVCLVAPLLGCPMSGAKIRAGK